jgi:glutamyl-tRNA(Gln) amidotransferase subunit D
MAKAKKAQSSASGAAPIAQAGDEVKVLASGATLNGILLPRKGGDGAITLKLPSGYNIGVLESTIEKIEVISARETPKAAADAHQKKRASADLQGKVLMLGCGGTIASKIDYKTGAVYPATTPEELLASFPSVAKEGVAARTLFSVLSEDMTPSHWVEIAKECAGSIEDGAEGIVVTHGTDTLSFTSAALSFMLSNLHAPIIFTGSQRSSDRGSSDSEVNVRASVFAARADISGVFACMHEGMSDNSCLLHFGTKVRKMHTSRRDAFHSISCIPAARVFPYEGKLEPMSDHLQPRGSGKPKLDSRINQNVALVHTYPGMPPRAISSLSSYDGVVIAGTGLGHVSVNLGKDPRAIPLIDEIKSLISSGIPVVVASQTIYGRVNMSTYSTGRVMLEAGVIGHMCDMTPETALVKLMCVLGREKKMPKIKELMESDLAGEITARSEISDY